MIILSTAVGIGLDCLHINPVKALWTAIINGLLAPFLLVGILLLAPDPKIMRNQPSPKLTRIIVLATLSLMFAAAMGMFLF